MTESEQLTVLKRGVPAWNKWRADNDAVEVHLEHVDFTSADLSGANLSRAFLLYADFDSAKLMGANLDGARLYQGHFFESDLSGASLRGADLRFARLRQASVRGADLTGASLQWAELFRTDFSYAVLRCVDLRGAALIETVFTGANLEGCNVYGVSVWDVTLDGANEKGLIIDPDSDSNDDTEKRPAVIVDCLDVAQFIYLLLNNARLRYVLDTITSKVVLILGRFTAERKRVLDAIREELRRRAWVPILFDVCPPSNRDLTEVVSTLAHLSRFIIADMTDPRSVPHELASIVPHLPSVPLQPLLCQGASEYAVFEHFRQYPWVLNTITYERVDEGTTALAQKIIDGAEARARQLSERRR